MLDCRRVSERDGSMGSGESRLASDIELTNNLSDLEAAGTNASAGTHWH